MQGSRTLWAIPYSVVEWHRLELLAALKALRDAAAEIPGSAGSAGLRAALDQAAAAIQAATGEQP